MTFYEIEWDGHKVGAHTTVMKVDGVYVPALQLSTGERISVVEYEISRAKK